MADLNPFDLLGDDDAEDPSQLIAKVATAKKTQAPAPSAQKQPQQQPAKLPSKPLPPAEAVKEAKTEFGRGGGRGGGRGRGRGRGGAGLDRETTNNGSSFGSREFSGGIAPPEEADSGRPSERRGGYGGPRGPYRGGRRGGFADDDTADGERPRRVFDRRSGTGRGSDIKREGSGRANWGTQTDELTAMTDEVEKNQNVEKPSREEEEKDANKETPIAEAEEKEPKDKEMTLEEYEKVLEEKRKALQALKTEERKVDAKEFESMQQISKKKNNDDEIFIKLGSEKDKRKEASEKEEKAKKSVSINEFLKPADGERYYGSGGRRGRGRGRGGYRGGDATSNVDAPSIEDPGHFPTLGGK